MKQPGLFARAVNAVGRFFITVVKSCYDMEWYRVVRVRPWTAALRYAMAFNLALMVFTTAALVPGFFALENGFIAHVNSSFPDDARLEVKGGRLSTSLAEPFEAGTKDFRVVIDTAVQGTNVFPETLGKADGMLVGKDAIFLQNNKNERRIYLLTDFSDFEVTKTKVLDGIRKWGAALILVALIIVAAMFWTLSLASTALYVAIASALATAIGRLWGVRLTFSTWFAIGLHAVTLPVLVNMAITVMGSRIPLAYTFIYFMFVAAVIADERNQPTGKPVPRQDTPTSPQEPMPPAGPSQDGGGQAPTTRKIAKRRPPAKKPPSESAE